MLLPQSHVVSFNKRTHASTIYKQMAAKHRLRELERGANLGLGQHQSLNSSTAASKRIKLSAEASAEMMLRQAAPVMHFAAG